ncbi:hypothetical protein [Nonomuraea antimicrobica]
MAADLLRRELGGPATHVLLEEARLTRSLLPTTPRLLLAALK